MIHYYHYSDLSHIIIRHYCSYSGEGCNLITDTRDELSFFAENGATYDDIDAFFADYDIDPCKYDEASEDCGSMYEAGGPYTLLEYAEERAWPYLLEDKETITWAQICDLLGYGGADFLRLRSGAPKSREATDVERDWGYEDDTYDPDNYNFGDA